MGFPSVGVVGVLSLLLGTQVARPLQPLISLNAVPANPWQVPWLAQRNAPDPTVAAIVDQYINTLAARGYAPEQQGVWVQTGTTAIATHQGTTPLPVASLTKLATTLAALATWPVDHQFETRIGRRGSVENGVLVGDLIILGGGDPYFVWEEAIVLANALQAQGIQQVSGNLVILGDFTMNFEADPYRSGELLRTAFDAGLWPPEAQQQYGTLPPATPQPRLKIGGTVVVENVAAADQVTAWVMGHQSLPLVALLKAMNIYSNNAMADNFARTVGGVNTIKAQVGRASTTALRRNLPGEWIRPGGRKSNFSPGGGGDSLHHSTAAQPPWPLDRRCDAGIWTRCGDVSGSSLARSGSPQNRQFGSGQFPGGGVSHPRSRAGVVCHREPRL
jgi:D-alanyl-D-alanine carboxypeptidase/D-alanyl-D-alanine-endopeptidase (penicillin-binding protein 4)